MINRRVVPRYARRLGAACLVLVGLALTPGAGEGPTTAPAQPPPAAPAASAGGIPAEVVEALKGLKVTSPTERKKVYDLLTEKGDARIIPALTAFLGGQLQLRDGRLIAYGTAQEVKGDGGVVRLFPVVDALTGDPVLKPDGTPLVEEMNLSGRIQPPLNFTQKEPVRDLIATLSLLHPDPEIRLASIRDAGERAARVFSDPDDEGRMTGALRAYAEQAKAWAPAAPSPTTAPAVRDPESELLAAIDAALADKPTGLLSPVPGESAVGKVASALAPLTAADKALGADPTTLPAGPRKPAAAHARLAEELSKYKDRLDTLKKNNEDLPKYAAAFKRHLAADPNGRFAPALKEASALTDAVLGDPPTRAAAVNALGDFGTSRAANVLRKLYDSANRLGDGELAKAVKPNLDKAESYQTKVRLAQYTFAGLSAGSIYVLLALGLGIIFGLMGVINMAHGEFMMIGAFITWVVASWFKASFPGAYSYFPLVAVPAAFLVSGLVGLLVEWAVVRHLYAQPIRTLAATIGVSIILVQAVRVMFGNNVSFNAPSWMQGSMEVAPDLLLNRARLWTIVYCGICIAVVYFMVNKTRLGLLLRATTQNREMAAALGVPTRWVDALTFAFGTGLAGLAGVIVPMVDKLNPGMGQDYVVDSFMVVVVGGVGKLAGAIVAGFGLGFLSKYLEPGLASIPMFKATSAVLGKVLVLAGIVAFLQRRPSGLFPPKGRVADA